MNNPTITANFDTNVRGLEEFEPNKDVILGPDLKMPSKFGDGSTTKLESVQFA